MEVVLGLLYEATDFRPRSAMIWNNIANARRMMMNDGNIMKQAKHVCKTREHRSEGKLHTPGDRVNQKPEVKPRRRLQPEDRGGGSGKDE